MITESGLVGYSYGFKLQGLGSFRRVTTIANFFLRKFANEISNLGLVSLLGYKYCYICLN